MKKKEEKKVNISYKMIKYIFILKQEKKQNNHWYFAKQLNYNYNENKNKIKTRVHY